jgi:hypothetical protein
MWHWLSWLKVWEWPERVMKWLRGLEEWREAKYKADKAKIELETARTTQKAQERERTIIEFYNEIKTQCEALPKFGFAIPLEPKAAPGEDPELVREAWLRYKREIEEKMNQSWRRR